MEYFKIVIYYPEWAVYIWKTVSALICVNLGLFLFWTLLKFPFWFLIPKLAVLMKSNSVLFRYWTLKAKHFHRSVNKNSLWYRYLWDRKIF